LVDVLADGEQGGVWEQMRILDESTGSNRLDASLGIGWLGLVEQKYWRE
jgi:hypothetical protein